MGRVGEPQARLARLSVVESKAAAVVLALVATFVVSCASTPSPPASLVASSRIDLDDGISLDPPPADVSPGKTAEEAWVIYAHESAGDGIPSSMTVRLGLLNGSGETNRLVWSYEDSTVTGCVYAGPSPVPGHPLPSRPADCNGWTFLDANTGAQVLGMQTPVQK